MSVSGPAQSQLSESTETPTSQSSQSLLPPIQCRIRLTIKVDQSWTIKRIIDEQCPVTWEGLFYSARFDIVSISKTLEGQDQIGQVYYPLKIDMFNAYRFTPLVTPTGLPNVKVVLVGQDPYPNTYVDMYNSVRPKAMGLSFSVNPDCPIPPSLLNMFKELERTYPGYIKPDHGSLVKWAQQGVFMFNTALTVKSGQPANAQWLQLWDGLITKTFKAIDSINPNCVVILMGNEAKKAVQHIGQGWKKVESVHPAARPPLSFSGSDVFRRANAYLIQQGHQPIDWQT